MKYFRGLKCKHLREVAEYYSDYKFLRCERCKTVRRVK